jgi:hypothetical protein
MDTLPGLTVREQQFLQLIMLNVEFFGGSPVTALRVAALLIEKSRKSSAPEIPGEGRIL